MESPENDNAVFRPSHKPWNSITPIPTFPLSRQPRDIYEKIPKRRRPKLPAPTGPFRLILGLEKTIGRGPASARMTFLPGALSKRPPSTAPRNSADAGAGRRAEKPQA